MRDHIDGRDWQQIIDRIVPPLRPMSDEEANRYPAEWTLWRDRDRIRKELAALSRPKAGDQGAAQSQRPEVRAFADLMEAQLRANDHKPGWKGDSDLDLFERGYMLDAAA